MTLQKVDWIVKYLQDKDARLSDLKEFFKIQNDDGRVKVKETSKNEYEYALKECKFILELEPLTEPKSHYRVKSISCLRK